MSEYTREEILKLIEEKGRPWGLDLSGRDLGMFGKALAKGLNGWAKGVVVYCRLLL